MSIFTDAQWRIIRKIQSCICQLQGEIGGSNPPNLPITATDSTGKIVDGSANVVTRPLTGLSIVNSAIVATDTILAGLGKAQGQLNARVVGPASSTDNALARFDATTGKIIQNSVAILGDTGILTGLTGETVVQPAAASSASQFPTAQPAVLTVTGGKGADSTFAGTATAANGGAINITSGAGGGLSASATGGTGGDGGQIRLLGGNGGPAVSAGTAAGDGGLVEIQGGDAGTSSGGATTGIPGYASIKAGNAAITGNGNGADVYIVGGIKNGTGIDGGIFMGVSPSNQRRGTTFIGCLQGDKATAASTDTLYVKGQAKFVDTPVKGVAAVNSDEFVVLSQLPAVPTTPNVTQVLASGNRINFSTGGMFFDAGEVPGTPVGVLRAAASGTFEISAGGTNDIIIMPTSGNVRILDSNPGGTGQLSLELYINLPTGNNTPITNTTTWNQGMANLQAQISATVMKTFTASGDGTTLVFTTPHGVTAPTMVAAHANSEDAIDGPYWTVINGANVEIHYPAGNPPSTGTNNLSWTLIIK